MSEAYSREGILENFVADGLDLLYYIEHDDHGMPTHFRYRLLLDDALAGDCELVVTEPAHRMILDGAKAEWLRAHQAKEIGDTVAALAFGWRGLRLLFPQLPQEPLDP